MVEPTHDDPMSTTESRNPLSMTLGVAKDGVKLAKPAVSAGFGIAHACVDAGFYIPKKITGFLLLQQPVDLAHSITKSSLQLSSILAHSSLEVSDRMLSMAGAQDGETYRILKDYVDSQSHVHGHDVREALLGVAALLVEVGQEIQNPLKLIQGAQKLALIHQEERRQRISKRQEATTATTTETPTLDDWSSSLYVQYATAIYGAQAALWGCCGSNGGDVENELVIPHPSELTSLSRHMKFAAAAYGAKSCKFMGCCDASVQYWTSNIDCIKNLTGIDKDEDILYSISPHDSSCLYRPSHFVALDHAHKELVISIRGTLSLHDVLVDLVCQSESFESVYDADDTLVTGKAHGGFLKSAQTLASDLHELVITTLRQYPSYQLVIVGHSLGGGVATTLALLWARIPEFRSRNIHATAYASPCVVSPNISQAPFTRRHVTSVVTGDDVVSRFGLTTFREMQHCMIACAETYTNEEQVQLPRHDKEEKLYCAGRVWWLESKEYEPHPIVEVDPVQELKEIGLFPDMFAIHLPNAYIASLEKLDRHHDSHGSDDVMRD